jgi:hypothetical protein
MFRVFRSKKAPATQTKALSASLVRGIDPEAKYCLRCGDEYRMEMSVCAVCGDKLISGAEKLAGLEAEAGEFAKCSADISFEDDLVGVRKGGVRDIKQLQQILAQAGIPAMISGDEQGCSKGCCGPEMYLLIRKTDMAAATKVFAREYVRTTALDSHDLSYGRARSADGGDTLHCPACGCAFSETVGACPDCGLCFD